MTSSPEGQWTHTLPSDTTTKYSPLYSDFSKNGFVVTPFRILSEAYIVAILDRLPKLFRGEFETGVYPDEWHWRQGISLQNVTREICNAWKSDRMIAKIVLNERLAKFVCEFMKWNSIRIAQDDVIWKPPCSETTTTTTNKTVVGFHQDSEYISKQFSNNDNHTVCTSVTVWMALDDVDPTTGSVEYVQGSHKWKQDTTELQQESASEHDQEKSSFHDCTADTYQHSIPYKNNNNDSTPTVVPKGRAIIHHEHIWHGSGPNTSETRHRRCLVIHYIRGDVQFKPTKVGYIYGRYKRHNSVHVDEDFFPILYAAQESHQKRSSWVDEYLNGK